MSTSPTPIPVSADLLDVRGIATYLGVTERFARRLVSERRVAVVKLGKLARVRRTDLDAYMAQNTIEAVSR